MPDNERNQETSVLYEGPLIRTRMAAWLLLGIGGLVMVPIGLISRAVWLPVLAVPILLVGLILLPFRLRIAVRHDANVVEATNVFLGLRVRRRRYPLGNVVGLDVERVAGAERERPSDTWYLKLQIHTTTRNFFGQIQPHTKVYTIGRYDDRLQALEARNKLADLLERRVRSRAPA